MRNECSSVSIVLSHARPARRCRNRGGGVHLDEQSVARRARRQVGDAGARHDAAALEDGHGVAHALDVGENVRGEEHRGAATERGNHLEHFASPNGVERARRLVEHEQARRVDERLRDAKPLLHSSRESADARGDRREPRHLQQRVGARVERRRVEPEQSARQREVLARGHPRIEARHVREKADARSDSVARPRDIVTEDVRGTSGWTCESREDA